MGRQTVYILALFLVLFIIIGVDPDSGSQEGIVSRSDDGMYSLYLDKGAYEQGETGLQ